MKAFKWSLAALLVLSLILLPARVQAQMSVGVQGGLSVATLTGDDVDDGDFDSRTGFLGGGFVALPLSERVGVVTGLYFAQKGANGAAADVDVKADYLQIPLLLQVGVAGNEKTGLALFAGPSLSFELSCKLEGGGMELDCDDSALGTDAVETKSTVFGGIVGVGVRHGLSGNMFLSANGGVDFGLQSVDDSAADEDVKTRMWFVQVGLGWTVGGDMGAM